MGATELAMLMHYRRLRELVDDPLSILPEIRHLGNCYYYHQV
jgi:hypothetical protein